MALQRLLSPNCDTRDDSEEIKAFKADRKALEEAQHQIVNYKLLLGSLEHANQEMQNVAQ